MWQGIARWITLLVTAVTTFVCGVLYISGFSDLKAVVIVASIVFVLMVVLALSMIAASPGPRTKEAVDRLKNKLFR